ncbi:ABC transporter substrate-binding protein [Nocardioides iriomotensis]|uniref:Extracellular solute-binding protein n=1 Tax=Nocardioides iriomotensis TaxID=715784 RepID=A0A4Q5J522_9ACTN|nr:extracellular solute-binding protein [Nocardioides iriomotensis]RYU12878.1 extracellular solute-binding protein [Nocardioides iriomotensis]
MKYTRWGLALLLALALTACGGASGTGNTDPTKVSGDIEPRAISWLLSRPADGAVITTVQDIAADYGKEHPGFSLELITTPDRPSYLQKLETLATAKKLPEFFDTDATPFADKLRARGDMVDVEKLLDELGMLDDYRPLALDYQRFDDGGLFLMPFEFELEAFWFNTKLFDKAGIDVPETLDDLVDTCGPLRDAGVVPIALDGQDQWPLERYMSYYPFRTAGPDYVKELKKGEASITDEPGRQAAGWIHDLGQAGCFPDGFSSTGYTDARDLFTTGKAAIYQIGTWELPTFLGDLPPATAGAIDYFTLPTTDGAVTDPNEFTVVSGIGTAINSRTFDPLVKDFVTYLLEEYPKRYAAQGRFSSTTNVETAAPESGSELFDKVVAQMDDLGDQTAMPWDTQLDPTSNSRLQQELTLLAQGETTPDEFLATVDETISENAPKYFE